MKGIYNLKNGLRRSGHIVVNEIFYGLEPASWQGDIFNANKNIAPYGALPVMH